MNRISQDLMLGVSVGLIDAENLIETIGILKELGVNCIKLPILWSRVMKDKSKINLGELDNYYKLFTELNKSSIKIIAVLNDQDSPDWYKSLGGWNKRENISFFNEYCFSVFKKLGSMVPYWITHNDPNKETIKLEKWAEEIPDPNEIFEALNKAHNINLSHGNVVEIFRHENITSGQIGICLAINPLKAKSMSITDILTVNYIDSIINRLHIDSVFYGRYPKDMLKFFEKYIGSANFIKDGDMKNISKPVDFIGLNYYYRSIVRYSQNSPLKFEFVKGREEKTDNGVEITPEYLYKALKKLKTEYSVNVPIFICECGGEFNDELVSDGIVNDNKRTKFIIEHLQQAQRFLDEHGMLKCFCTASLSDFGKTNINNVPGYGIAAYNCDDKKYVLKKSGIKYKEIISSRLIKH